MNEITTKRAIDTQTALQWLLGAAMVGGGLRAGVSLAHSLGQAPAVKLRDSSDLYDPEIEMPVDMTPAQFQKFKELTAQGTKGSVKAAAWDSTFNVVAGVGGGLAGWYVLNAMIKRRREKKVNQELDDLRTQLTALTGKVPDLADPLDPRGMKAAAAWDFLEIAAQRYVTHVKGSPENQVVIQGLRKTAGILDKILAGAKNVGARVSALDPLTKALLGGGAAVAAAPLVPGVSDTIDAVGQGVTNAAGGTAKAIMRPVGYGLASTLGPVAAVSLLYGLHKGFQSSKDRNKRIADLKAIRDAIRDQEIKEQPYFKLTPRVVEPAKATA